MSDEQQAGPQVAQTLLSESIDKQEEAERSRIAATAAVTRQIAETEAKRNVRHHRALTILMETRRDEKHDDLQPSDMPRLYKIVEILDEIADEAGQI